MICPFCKNLETKVTNKRDANEITRRRRECLKCGKRFTTYEKIEPIERYIVKKDGRREKFDQEKLLRGIKTACEKRPIPQQEIEKIVDEIKSKFLINKKEIPSKKIGEEIMKKLKKLDNVAYIRFASVYRDFHDVEDFKDIMKEVRG
jgi:transcriptional repressor NrdR